MNKKMNKKWILLMATTLLMVVTVSSIAISSVAAQSATRTLPSSVAPGGPVEVGIAATGYGMAGQVIETLPAGFDYVSSSLSPSAVAQVGQVVTFTLFGETSFTYTVTASSTPGTHTFSGILKDFDKNEYVVGGNTDIVVGGVVPTATRTLPSPVAPGGTVEVGIAATGYGMAGQVIETLPAGFDYVSSSLSPSAVAQVGQEVTFTLFGETSFTYNVTASSTPGTHTFSGILKDFDKNEYVVGGHTSITVTGVVPTATRTLPSSVAPGGTVEVGIAATDYGVAGQVIETLPAGFGYVSSSLSPSAVAQVGQEVTFTLFGETSFTYNVTASSTPGTHTFSGILKDFDKNEYVVGGHTSITVLPADTIPPTIISVSPTGATVAITTTVSATFSEPMNTASAEAAFSIIPAPPALVKTFNWVGDTMTYTPAANLDSGTKYTVTIGTGAQDLAGNPMASAYTWSFTTKSAVTPGGRRGGGGAYTPPVTTNVPVDSEGKVTTTTPLTTDKATLTIPAGIIVKDAAGNPLSTSVTMASTPSTAEKIGAIAAYDFGPSGTTFSEPIDLVIEYDPADVSAGAELVIKMYDGTAWIDLLPTTVDTVAHTATAKVSHFSIFALFAVAAPEEVVTPTPTVPAVVTPTPTATPVEEPIEKPKPWGLIIGIIIAVIIVGAAAYYFYTKKKA